MILLTEEYGGAAVFGAYVYEKSSAEFVERIMLIDTDDLERKTNYSARFAERGFQVIRYVDDLNLRLEHEEAIYGAGKFLLLVSRDSYVPYDVRQRFQCYEVSLANLFPKLNTPAIKEAARVDYDLLSLAYQANFADLRSQQATERFLKQTMYRRGNVEKCLRRKNEQMHRMAETAGDYKDWCRIADLKAVIDSTAAEFNLAMETEDIQERFAAFLLSGFGALSSVIDRDGPVLISRAMEYMRGCSDKFAIVIMDGMSQFDWQIIARSFHGIQYEKTDAFAMVPTTTPVSRQCLLANQYPRRLPELWNVSQEKRMFMSCAEEMGYTAEQIGYERGYNADFSVFVQCAAVIINDVDDLVHAQTQGRLGMYHDVILMAQGGQLAGLVKRLLEKGFDVYITSDHGNTLCTGMGRLTGAGVEVESKGRRMLVLKEFAGGEEQIAKYRLIKFPQYFLPKEWNYLICEAGTSFDVRGEEVMSHGGITTDEVIVPFIKIKAGENSG